MKSIVISAHNLLGVGRGCNNPNVALLLFSGLIHRAHSPAPALPIGEKWGLYWRHLLTAAVTTNISQVYVDFFCMAGDNFLLKYVVVLLACFRTAPMPVPEALVSKMNGSWKLGKHSMLSMLILVGRTCPSLIVLQNDIDLLNPPADLEKRKHKLKRLVQSPNSFFMDVKCQGCFNITTVFSHSQTVVVCGNCQTVLCQPTGGKARLTEGCSFRRKGD
ncbi:40S ribosomal protein S27-2 [Platanthera zijinensis]|uniref:40S ribosomal protein S27 n=1 Tax=Platanthera zijinensis TaxID=2320716 RepID=A0AAP0ATB5_9ASPA